MEEETIVLRDYLDILIKKWWVLLLGSLLVGVMSAGFTFRPLIVLPPGSPVSVSPPGAYDAIATVSLEGADFLAKFPELAKSRPVLEGAIAGMGLPYSVAELRDRVSVTAVQNTPLLHITATDLDQARAVETANAVAQSLVNYIAASPETRAAVVRENLDRRLEEPDPAAVGNLPAGVGGTLVLFAGRPSILVPAEVEDSPKAVGPPVSAGPPLVRNFAIGFLIGGIVTTMVVMGLEYVRSPVRSPDQLERRLALTRLGVLPRWKKRREPYSLVVTDDSELACVEALRHVATYVGFSNESLGIKTLAIVSPDPEDGRSSLTANLGVALANSWKDVVLVDADLRRPSLHRYFELDNCAGLSTFMVNPDLDVADIIQKTANPRLRVITSGPIPSNPVELLTNPRMKWLLEHLKETSDVVVVDTPSMLATTDGTVLASRVDGVVVLANAVSSRLETMSLLLENLRRANATTLGFVWNRMVFAPFSHQSRCLKYYKRLKSTSNGNNTGRPDGTPAYQDSAEERRETAIVAPL